MTRGARQRVRVRRIEDVMQRACDAPPRAALPMVAPHTVPTGSPRLPPCLRLCARSTL